MSNEGKLELLTSIARLRYFSYQPLLIYINCYLKNINTERERRIKNNPESIQISFYQDFKQENILQTERYV
jgi:hypothetical protein